ncbi:unnamed protein product [Symbiodinium microadriaticum]|nr:unnamed protein product [Symbiodinium microadriaticum]|mmetsp:Transcript_77194/g.184814  ORF Transcript_77194/g.184814 Transcript_77194/m.184814 type:complete len:245 (+) Transcript_77194:54-788(+)
MGQSNACFIIEDETTTSVNMSNCMHIAEDSVQAQHASHIPVNSVNNEKEDEMYDNPLIPNCDISTIPRALLPDRMGGLTDQECADVLLAQAAVRGELKDVQRALRDGARVDTRAELCIAMGDANASLPRKLTPLMRACACGHYEVVCSLLEAKASLWRVDSRGWTPLCHALANCELSMARHLLAEAGTHRERQLKMMTAKRDEIVDYCEEWVGGDSANQLHNEFELGFLEDQPTKLELLKQTKV